MTDPATRFHAQWLGLVQPSEGLVFSLPVLVESQCMEHQPTAVRQALQALAPEGEIADLPAFFAELLQLLPDEHLDFSPPETLALHVAEGHQTLRPTAGIRAPEARPEPPDAPPAVLAGAAYAALIWDLPPGLPLDKPETTTGPWRYPPSSKFDRLLRAARVPVGLLTNRRVVRLIYAPHGQSTGWIDFRLADMQSTGGAPILDAFVVLLRADRWFSVPDPITLPGLLAQSRTRQANVTNDLADQVFAALTDLLQGFDRANDRDPRRPLDAALADGTVYNGLLTVLLRLVFLLYAEEHDLLPVEHPLYAEHHSVLGLYDQLQHDRGQFPDEQDRRFGAWPRLLATFRAVYFGVEWHGADPLIMPARQGNLFDPDRFPWLEGRLTPGATLDPTTNAQVRTPALDDATVFALLDQLIVVQGQRLSYKALDVEQIGSVYERLMGFSVQRLVAPAICLRPTRVWVTGEQVMAQPKNRLAAWLQDEVSLGRAPAQKLALALAPAEDSTQALALLAEHAGVKKAERVEAGRLILQPGPERRRTSSHYTPRSLSAPIVARTLEPLIRCIGGAKHAAPQWGVATEGSEAYPSAESLLELKICDPAMGSGAFLVEACRYLADQVVAAWTRDGTAERLAATVPDLAVHARRRVAQRCLYGVDKNPFAVELARMSLWLVTLARDLPFTFVDHALRHGDSLVGLSLDQIRGFHWQPEKQSSLFNEVIKRTLDDTVEIRRQILDLADSGDTAHKARLLHDAERFTEEARLIADVCVGAFFAQEKPAAREAERKRRLEVVERWLIEREEGEDARDPDRGSRVGSGDPGEAGSSPPRLSAEAEVRAMAAALRAEVPAFHWMLEFPEVFYAERPDPLQGGALGVAWMDAFVGNPPFVGGRRIRSEMGDAYTEWLGTYYDASMNADISAHFFTRAHFLLGPHGTAGLIATNTIGQGDTREAGLARVVASHAILYEATTHMAWPGDAAVTVSVVHFAKGEAVARVGSCRLDDKTVSAIDSSLRAGAERPEAAVLAANAGKAYQGAIVLGMGFTLTPEEREALVRNDPSNAERTFPYLGGQEVNTSPTQSFDRYVISFGDIPLEEAAKWPALLGIVRERVKPERDVVNRDTHRKYWWHFGDKRPALFAALAPLKRCLVNSQVSKHLIFAWQPTDRVFSHALNVFPLDNDAWFAVLQSRIHEPWARLLSSSMKSDLRYAASDCLATFPFPADMTLPTLNAAGEALNTARAAYMIQHNQGLTTTYNQLKDPKNLDPEIERLRRLHEAMDRAVLAAYGWQGIPVPAYGTADPEAQRAFDEAVIDRLFALNAKRAAEEKKAAEAAEKAASEAQLAAKISATPKKARAKKPRPDDDNQGSLF